MLSIEVSLRHKQQEDHLIQWSDIDIYSRCNPEKAFEAVYWIDFCLGYKVNPHVFMPHIAFVQVLANNALSGIIDADTFINELEFHCKRIRNDDMKKNGWVESKFYNPDDYELYKTHLPQYKQAARDRITEFMGYEPFVDHSFEAEVLLRDLFIKDSYYNGMPFGELDTKAGSIVRYRECYIMHGEEVADSSDLIGLFQERLRLREMGID